VKAWNATHYGIRTVTLVGVMDGIDVIINTPLPDITPPATAQPQMHGISGLVYMSEGVTEASWGTNFCVNNTNPTVTTGGYIEGKTGAGPYSGWYSVAINGTDGDEITVKAWNATHYGIRTVTLVGDMRGIDVIINTPLPDITPPASVSDLNEIDKGITWILWNWTNPSDADFNHTKVRIDGEFKVNVATPEHSYNATGLNPGTTYVISTRTVDESGNINQTWVNDTATITDPWAEINEELDSLIEKLNATCITHRSTKRILIYKLKLAQAMKDYAHGKYNTGTIGFGKKELEEVKRQVESFEDLVKRTSKISYADKLIFLADSAEIKAKITALIEYIETEHSC
jgi:hypothetical protein